MELNKELYQRTFSRLRVSPDFGKELLAMTEKTRKPKKFILRRLAVAALVIALAAALTMGAYAATGGELMGTVLEYVKSITIGGSKADMFKGEIDGQTVYYTIEKQETSGEVQDEIIMEDDEKTQHTITEYDGEKCKVLETERSLEAEGSSAPEE